MIPELRQAFNARFTPEKYGRFLAELDRRCGAHVKFRNSETPCFFPAAVLGEMVEAGRALIHQLTDSPEYLKISAASVPPQYNAPNETKRPLFIQADFGLDENLKPKLVELQGFPSIYAYQPVLAETYRDIYGLEGVHYQLTGKNYWALLGKAILGDRDPENVVLMEIDPWQQKTATDFLLTEKYCGVKTVAVTDIRKRGNRLYHGEVPIERIYNRVIVDELERKDVRPGFDFRDDLDVEWAGHPNWYFRISKFSLPYLKHESVPETRFLSDIRQLPRDLENYVLKPLYSFAGLGVVVGPSRAEVEAADPARFILQRRVNFAPVIHTPFGPTKAEVRVMYIWADELEALTTIIRMGRGKMMGVDHNRDMEWVGASAGFIPDGPDSLAVP